MKAYRLTDSVCVRGQDFWGRSAVLRFHPNKKGEWVFGNGKGVTEITPDCLQTKRRRLMIENIHSGQKLNVWEHITPLRFAGVIGVGVDGTAWPPYHGRALEVWQAVKPKLVESNETLPIYTIRDSVTWTYPKARNCQTAYVRIEPPREEGKLTVDVTCRFPLLGERRESFIFPDSAELERVLAARTLGQPRLYYFLCLLASVAEWPHYDRRRGINEQPVLWVRSPRNATEAERYLQEIVEHRVQDLLGALALLCKDGLFAGHVTSVCAGHLADMHVVQQAFPQLVRT